MANAIKKTLYVLNIDNYSPDITGLTYPFIKKYAHKIGADICEITERKSPDMPITYEKLQIYDLAKRNGSDWNIYLDLDALVHPETIDFTEFIHKDTVMHNGSDFANVRWKYDDIFRRDGRNIGSCNWFTIASDWCLDLWRPLDLPLQEALDNIFPTVTELNTVITREHLIDDYTLSRNIARYGLKFTTALSIMEQIGLKNAAFFYHIYTETEEAKVNHIKEIIQQWNISA